MCGHWLGAKFRKQAPQSLASSCLQDKWWRDYRGRNLSYRLWLCGCSGMRETVYTSKTHRSIQRRSSGKQLTWWGTTRNLLKIFCNNRKHDASYSLFLLRTLVEYKELVMDPLWVLFILSFVLLLFWFRRSCRPWCMAFLYYSSSAKSLSMYCSLFIL